MKVESRSGKVLLTAAKIGAAGLAAGLASGAGTTLLDHRKLTHRSIELALPLEKAIESEHRDHGITDPTVWASVHRVHHRFSDVSIEPFYKISRAIAWINENQEKAAGVNIPDSFKYLDPFVDEFSRDDVLEIGRLGEQEVRERMGPEYEEPQGYTSYELNKILNPAGPQYYYPTEKRREGPYTQDEIARLLLGDPHSPARIPPPQRNGIRGVVSKNVGLYSDAAKMFTARPDLKPEDLQEENDEIRKAGLKDILSGLLLPSVAVLLKRGEYKPKDFAIAAAGGAAIYGTKIGFVILGGNTTNAFGHAGRLTGPRITEAIGKNKFKLVPNEDGSLTTDTKYAGIPGAVLSRMTLDEVGGQQEHHSDPSKIAYTSRDGKEAFKEAPFGSIVSKLAKSRWFPLIKEGKGFDLKEGETRPDVPQRAVEIIHRRRAEQLRNDPKI